ncbi:MAG: hypothetical protein HGA45_37795, partial [Chloroflexales bacterium]|nr:hypothetical protein [Chloroflexales bacterium]
MSIHPPAPLLRTKITLPPPRRVLLPRGRLLGLLDEGLAQPVTLVAAGAGFGKSTMVSQWLTEMQNAKGNVQNGECSCADPHSAYCILHSPPQAAWLTLDAGDNDPVRFWRYVLAAVEQAVPGVSTEASALLDGPQTGATDAVIATLLNHLQSSEEPLVLALDDYHVIEHAEIHRGLAYAIDHLPAHVNVVLISRADPPLPLSRWRARGQLTEVRAAQLRFTPEEAHAFLAGPMGLDLAPAQTTVLEARTEGWAAGLQLAALSLRGQPDPDAFIAQFAASHRTALDYLIDEVVARQPSHLQHFLLQTAMLDRLCPALCDAVLGVAQPQGEPYSRLLLNDLEQQNLFLIPLDAERGWYRYHHLF